ncbi:MAG TPA: DNA polymerase III subunit delta, partial [Chloroflexota bacterium]|nr:DNA polymerase III subunit delta [Chloroflexota bacterium]
MLHVLHGPDDYSIAATVAALIAEHGGADGYVTRLDGASCAWTNLREACFTMPLFASAQVIVVRGLLGAWSGRGEGGKAGAKPAPAEFASFVQQAPETLQLILHEGELTAANRYLKELSALPAAQTRIRAFPLPLGPARQRWISQIVRERGGSIDAGALALLAERRSGALHGLALEIDKLLSYTAPQLAIRRPDVELLVAEAEETSGFDLVDAVSHRQAARVVELMQRYLAAGQAPEQILALLGARIRDLVLLAAAAAEGVSDTTVQARAGWTPGRLAHLQ